MNGRSQKKNNSPKQPRRSRKVAVANYTIPAATLTRTQPRQSTTSTTQRGSDVLDILSMDSSTNYPLGSVIMSGVLTASSSARLATLAEAFQRIRWNNIRFTIEGAFPTTCGGGYIACFVRDPTDVPPTDPQRAIRWAMAQQQSVDSKWYDSTGVMVGRTPDLLYTSIGDGLRFSSPGTFYIISKGGPAQVGAITVKFYWDVTLSEPTVDGQEEGRGFAIKDDYYFQFDIQGPALLSRLTHLSPNPHDLTYSPVTTTDIGIGKQVAGTYISLPNPVTLTGMYSTGNDYIPVYVSGLAINEDQTLTAVYVIGTTQFYTLQVGNTYAPPAPFEASNWHIASGGIGTVLEPGVELSVLGEPTALVSTTVNLFTARGTEPFIVKGRRMATAVPDVDRATVALSGERLRAW